MLTLIAALLTTQAHAAEGLKFLTSSAATAAPLEGLVKHVPLTFAGPVHNLKLSIVFEKPLAIGRLKLESCAKDWDDGIQIFTSPGLTRSFSEGGKSELDVKLAAPLTQSIALVFGKDSQLCLKNLSFFDKKNQPIEVETPSSLAVASDSESLATLTDGHPETKVALEDPVTLSFSQAQKFDRAIVWTANSSLYAHSLKLVGDKGWSETLPLRHATADQEVIFKKPFEGKQITITAPDAGEIGELRFANGTKVQSLATQSKPKSPFDKLLDSSWVTDATSDDRWTFLFRSDGTFFVKGVNDDAKQARDYAGLGGYTVLRQTTKELKLKINGVRFATSLAWDGVMCPFSCGNEGVTEIALTDSIVFEIVGQGSIIVRNRTPRAQRTLTFSDLKLHRAIDD